MLVAHALRAMEAQGAGRIVNVSSAAGRNDPPAPPGEGGWGVLYGMAKAAQIRIAGAVRAEHQASRILCFSLNPGFVKTPVIREMPVFRSLERGLPASTPGAVIAWLATSDEAERYDRQMVDVPTFLEEHPLFEG